MLAESRLCYQIVLEVALSCKLPFLCSEAGERFLPRDYHTIIMN